MSVTYDELHRVATLVDEWAAGCLKEAERIGRDDSHDPSEKVRWASERVRWSAGAIMYQSLANQLRKEALTPTCVPLASTDGD